MNALVPTTPTLNKLIELIELVSVNQMMVNDFGVGPLWNLNALVDIKTPYIWVVEGTSRITMGNLSHKTGLYSFTIYCMDRISKGDINYQETLNDTKFILDTIMTELDQHPYFVQLGLSFDRNTDIIMEPLYEETTLNCNGHSCTFTWKYPIRLTPCNVPILPIVPTIVTEEGIGFWIIDDTFIVGG